MKTKAVVIMALLMAFLLGYKQIAAEVQPQRINALAENVLKIAGNELFNFGPRGFGVHDSGDEKFKILDWNFNIIKEISIKSGEGPGEIKQEVHSACWLDNDQFILHGLFERKINKYDKDGAFIKSFPIDFVPMKVLAHRSKIYIVNQGIEFSDNSNAFLQVLDRDTGKTLKKVKFRNVPDPEAPKVDGGRFLLNICLDKDGMIYFLYGATATVYKIDEDGTLIAKIPLPYKDLKKIIRKKNLKATCWEKNYKGISIIGDSIYTSFMDLQKDYSGKKKADVYLIKVIGVTQTGKSKEKEIYGYFDLVGNTNDCLYLFDVRDYSLLPVKISELILN